MDMVHGYKAFNKDFTNRHGEKFEVGKTYIDSSNISFGNDSEGGFHMCSNLEDTLKFVPAFEEDVVVCEVTGSGKIVEGDRFEDDYYGFYDMYSVERLTIDKVLSRKEVVDSFLNMSTISSERICRFVQFYKLHEDEEEMFKLKFGDSNKIMQYISYYQDGDKEAFNTYTKRVK